MGLSRSIASGALFICSACSVIIDAEPTQCTVDDDCAARGREFSSSKCNDGFCSVVEEDVMTEPEDVVQKCTKDPECDRSEACIEKKCQSRWECIDDEPPAPGSATEMIAVDVRSGTGTGGNTIIPNVPAKVCGKGDPQCLTPLSEVVSDENGVFHLMVPANFTGYLDVTAEGFFPQLYYLPPNLTAETVLPSLSLTPELQIFYLAAGVGAEPDPERGHIYLTILSCLGVAPGVSLELQDNRLDEKTIPYFIVDQLPSADTDQTTNTGTAGFLNVSPGSVVVDLTSGKAGEIGSMSFTVRPGYLTVATFNPVISALGAP